MNHRTPIACLLCLITFNVAAHAEPAKSIWPQWRGPTRDGSFIGPKWPSSLDEKTLKAKWRVELGPSYSGPIVTEKLIFTTETKDKQTEIVRALNRDTGEEVWKQQWDGSMSVPFFAAKNGSWIRATPAYDGESLFVAGMRDVLVCLDAATGKPRWRVDFMKRFDTPLPSFGFVSSPLVEGDAVYVQAGAAVVKLNKKTGETIWRSLADGGGMYGSAFSSPVLAPIQGKPQLIVQTRNVLAGLNPDSGDVLWKQEIKAFRGMNILTPTVFDNTVFTSAYGGRAHQFKISDDADDNEGFRATEAWQNRLQAYMSSPVVIDDHLYLHLRSNRIACTALRDGEVQWISSESFGDYCSLVKQDDRILALDQRGTLYLIRANTEKLDIIDQRRVANGDAWAHLAVAGKQIVVRELNALNVFNWGE